MRTLNVLGLAAVLTALTVPGDASAQIADRVRREQRERDRYDRYDRDDRGRAGRASGGPAFCRSGRGHPVKGRRWCIEKGFGLGGWGWDRRYDDYRWDRVRWDDVVFRDRRDRDRDDRRDRYERRDDRYDGRQDGGWLKDVVGDVVFGRLSRHGRSNGWSDPLSGEWFDDGGARVLTVYSGARPLAELIDRNHDGRAEDVRLVRIR